MDDPKERVDVWTADGRAFTVPREQVQQAIRAGLLLAPPQHSAPAPPSAQAPGVGLDDILGPTLQGLTFGLGDEAAAGIGAGMDWMAGKGEFGDRYNRRLQAHRQQLQQSQERHPVISTAATIGGAVLNPAFVPARGSTLAETARAAVSAGVKSGALSGAGAADGDLGDRAVGAARGAAIGGAVGGAIPVVGSTIRGITQRVADSLADTPIGSLMGHIPGITMPGQDRGTQKILEALQRDGMSLADAEARVAELSASGKPINLADAGRENVRGLADASMIPPTQARADAAQQLVERSNNAGGRISGDLAKATGVSRDMIVVSDALATKRRMDAKPLYDAAYAKGENGVVDPDLMQFLHRPAFKDALKEAYDLAANEGRQLPNVFAKDGSIAYYPNLETLDYVKRAIDGMISTAKRSASMSPDKIRVVKTARDQFVSLLDQHFPEYAQARYAYAGPSQLMDAMEAGTKFAKLDAADIEVMLRKEFNTPAEREHFLLGAVDTIRKAIADAPDGSDVYKRVFGNMTKREQLKALFPSPEKFAEFEQAMAAEKQMRITADAVRGNSRTAHRQWALEDLGSDPITPVSRALTGDWKGALGQAASSRLHGVVGANAEAIVPQLFGDPQAALGTLRRAEEALRQKAAKPARAPATVGNLGGLLGSGVFR